MSKFQIKNERRYSYYILANYVKKIMLNLFFKRAIIVALSVIVLNVPSKFHAEALNPGNNKVCIDPGHQAKGNKGLEEVAPGSSTKKIRSRMEQQEWLQKNLNTSLLWK